MLTVRRFRAGLLLAGSLLFALATPASALEYRSTGHAAVLYDAPSTAAGKLTVAGSGLPFEVVVDTEAWVKVRDYTGRLAWIEKSALDGPRSVMIKAETGTVRQQPRADAPLVFRAARGVLLNVTGKPDATGWLPVKHANGLTGWILVQEVWGQ
ncbi:SH3 domain-containing protein [Thiobacillus sp.]|uniref:SH3 domain-containing protein n=1 Tax=Thiobacillus sp. TaxID=924 RepID=UPI0025D0970C|nr:SH3 domain-containing protein [Thiobacillus sp.]